jgi:hypothetical protein
MSNEFLFVSTIRDIKNSRFPGLFDNSPNHQFCLRIGLRKDNKEILILTKSSQMPKVNTDHT